MVVPGSARKIDEDQENALYTVTLFQKVIDEYKSNCREHKCVKEKNSSIFIHSRFIVRDFVYDEQSLKAGKSERDKLVQEKQRQYAPLVRWLKINFGEIFSAYVHVKALRVFVESVLRSVITRSAIKPSGIQVWASRKFPSRHHGATEELA
jgi:V-type H+-transporting ATPase subunit C